MQWWDLQTKKLTYCSSKTIIEQNDKLGKLLLPSSELMNGTHVSTLPTLKIFLSDHPLVKYDRFEVTVTYPQRGTPISIVAHYCKHHKMLYISQSTKNIPWNHDLPDTNRTNV